jgi:hypothetical protein
MAFVYGHETATRRSSDGKENTRSLSWTGTWPSGMALGKSCLHLPVLPYLFNERERGSIGA